MPNCLRSSIGKYRTSIIAIFLTLIVACWLVRSHVVVAASPQEAPVPPEIRITLQDTQNPIRLCEEQVLQLSLDSNPSTGYRWELREENGDELQITDDPLILSIAEPVFESANLLLGAPTKQLLRLKAVQEGSRDYQLIYRRPWEKDIEPLQTLPLTIAGIGAFSGDHRAGDASASEPESYIPPLLSEDTTAQGLPARWHWCEQGGCTPVKAQGSCGSCWTFGTVGALECNILIQDGVVRNLAEQYLLSCNTDGWGCNGGWFAHSYHIWKKPPGELYAGAVYENDFPYWGYQVACNPPHTHHEKITSWSYVVSTKVRPAAADIKRAIYEYGPVSASVCVGWRFQNYGGGIFERNECQDVNHAIVLVGWDDTQGTQGVWYLRNSWGSYWGESGYMRIGYGICNVGYATNYVVYGSDRPTAPSNLTAVPVTTTFTVNLAWEDNNDDETGFAIERSRTGTGGWSQITTVPGNVITYQDSGLSVGVYFYRVRAHNNSLDYSGYTAVRSATFGLDSQRDLPVIYSSTEHRLLNEPETQCVACGDR